jgi:hypothetical protein
MLERKAGQGRNIGLHKIIIKKFHKMLQINQSKKNSKQRMGAIINKKSLSNAKKLRF